MKENIAKILVAEPKKKEEKRISGEFYSREHDRLIIKNGYNFNVSESNEDIYGGSVAVNISISNLNMLHGNADKVSLYRVEYPYTKTEFPDKHFLIKEWKFENNKTYLFTDYIEIKDLPREYVYILNVSNNNESAYLPDNSIPKVNIKIWGLSLPATLLQLNKIYLYDISGNPINTESYPITMETPFIILKWFDIKNIHKYSDYTKNNIPSLFHYNDKDLIYLRPEVITRKFKYYEIWQFISNDKFPPNTFFPTNDDPNGEWELVDTITNNEYLIELPSNKTLYLFIGARFNE